MARGSTKDTAADKTGHADSPRQDGQRPEHSDHADAGGQLLRDDVELVARGALRDLLGGGGEEVDDARRGVGV